MDRPEDTPAGQAAHRLALIDTFERDGRTGRVLDVRTWPLVLGRGMDSDVVLEDPFVAERHARIGPDAEGRLLLTVLDTVNGVELNGRRLRAGSSVPLPEPGQPCTLQLGQTRLRLRLAGAVVPAELPLPLPQRSPLWLAVPLYALLMADLALGLDPGADTSAWLSGALGLPAALMAWCAGWALLSKLFQHRFDFMGHLRIALPWALAVTAVDLLLPQVAATFGAAWLWHLGTPVMVVLGAFWLYAHLAHVLPQHRRAVQAGVLSMTLVGAGITLNASWKSRDSLLSAPYMSTLPLPALRLQAAGAPAELVQAMATLGPPLARRAKQARADDRDSGMPDDAEQD